MQKKCTCCDEQFDDPCFTTRDGDPICERCYEAQFEDPCATVFYCCDDERWSGKIGEYNGELPDGAEGFNCNWSGAGYRGAYSMTAPEGWVRVINDWFCPLDGHNIEGRLQKFQEIWDGRKERRSTPTALSKGMKTQYVVGQPRQVKVKIPSPLSTLKRL